MAFQFPNTVSLGNIGPTWWWNQSLFTYFNNNFIVPYYTRQHTISYLHDLRWMNVVKCEQLELTLSAKHSTQSIDHPYWTAHKPATTSRLVPTQQVLHSIHAIFLYMLLLCTAWYVNILCRVACTVECPVSQTACLSSEQNTHAVIIIDYY